MKTTLIIFLFLSLFPLSLEAAPNIDWMREYDTGSGERFFDIFPLIDGGYVLCGERSSDDSQWNNGADYLLMKIDDRGNMEWNRFFGLEDTADYLNSIIETDGGTYITCGTSKNTPNWTKPYAAHIDADGEIIWQRYLANDGGAEAVIELKNNNYACAGSFNSYPSIYYFNIEGELLWHVEFDQVRSGRLYTLKETDNGVVACGRVASVNSADLFVMKVDFNGEIVWQSITDPFGQNNFVTMCSRPAGGFLLSGMGGPLPSSPARMDHAWACINADGELQWSQRTTFPPANMMEQGRGMARLSDGGCVMVGFQQLVEWQEITDASAYVIRLREDGSERWRSIYRFGEMDEYNDWENNFTSVVEANDRSIIACGTIANSDDELGQNGLVIKLMPELLEIDSRSLRWSPRDTMLTLLIGDTTEFIAHVLSHEETDIDYLWVKGQDTLSNEGDQNELADTTITCIHSEMGDYIISCLITDTTSNDNRISVNWHCSVKGIVIRDHSPDSLDLELRRGSMVDFSLIAESVDGEPEFLWRKSFLDDPGQPPEDAGRDASVTISFLQSGNYAIEGLAYRGESSDAVTWNVSVKGVVWSFAPEDLALEVLPDSLIRFEVIPSNPEDSSLSVRWFVDEELAAEDTTSLDWGFFYPVHSVHNVLCVLSDSIESDTVFWTVTVRDLSVKDKRDAYPTRLAALLSVSPNPFNSTLTIRYSSPINREATSISIHDISGREVFSAVTAPSVTEENSRAVKRGGMTAERTLTWDASNIPAGVYFVRLQSGMEVSTKKVVLIR